MSSPIRILMLEDDPFDGELNERALKRSGLQFESQQVDTEEAFKAALTDFKPDLVLSDFNLPGYDGFSALEAVKTVTNGEIPFILVTGAIGEESSVQMLKMGAFDYILKDRLARLPDAVNRA